jgi:hypothetical protein
VPPTICSAHLINVVNAIISRRVRWDENAAGKGEVRNIYKIYDRRPCWTGDLRNLVCRCDNTYSNVTQKVNVAGWGEGIV